jgi:ketosteroid isomerase-like protein
MTTGSEPAQRRRAVIADYLRAMQAGDMASVLACFSESARVVSPTYGEMPVRPFYERLFADTVRVSIDLRQVYAALDDADRFIAHFGYVWERRGGPVAAIALVDLFVFEPGSDRIARLTIASTPVEGRRLEREPAYYR